MHSLQPIATFHSRVRNRGSCSSEDANHICWHKGNTLVNTVRSVIFSCAFLSPVQSLVVRPQRLSGKTFQKASGGSQCTAIRPPISSLGNVPFIGSAWRVKFNHYLALAHSALTSFSLMSSQRLSCSICRSRSLMSPIVTHIGRNCSHTVRTHTHCCHTLGGRGAEGGWCCRRWHSCLQTDALPSDKDRGSSARETLQDGELWGFKNGSIRERTSKEPACMSEERICAGCKTFSPRSLPTMALRSLRLFPQNTAGRKNIRARIKLVDF